MKHALLCTLVACGTSSHAPAPPPVTAPASAPTAPSRYTTSTIALPGGDADGVGMDYLLYDPRTNAVWVPAGNSAAVDVIDVATGKLTRIEGFPTREMERRGKKRVVGPSSATLGARGTVYVGNRADSTVCAVDEVQLAKQSCGTLDSMPDGIAYVSSSQEVWVTTPRDKSIRILDAATLVQKAKLDFDGEPEGFAAAPTRGLFYTNLEDKDVTLAIDVASHKTLATWQSGCGEQGPHGLRLDDTDGLLLVACSTRVEALDLAHDGKVVGSVDTGDGVDDFDFAPATRRVYVGAARAGQLVIAALDPKGALSAVATVPTAEGARNGVVTTGGRVYLAHSKASELIVVAP
jgi:DNA-binding beta-propeller fold protein YncE